MPMLEERLACLREAGRVLYEVCRVSPDQDDKILSHLTRITEIRMQSCKPD